MSDGATPLASNNAAESGNESLDANRRAFPRRRGKGEVTYRPAKVTTVVGLTATLVDISHGGVRLLVKQHFAIGDCLELSLTPKYGHGTLTRQVEVRWVQQVAESKCYLGCSWRHRLSFEELQKFL